VLDGSSLPFAKALLGVGIAEQKEKKDYHFIEKPVSYGEQDVQIIAVPSDVFSVSFTIDYSNPVVGSQYIDLPVTGDAFVKEIAPARTYCFQEDVDTLKAKGLIKGGSLGNAIVISEKGVLNEEPLRFPDEFVRHKIADFLGDFALLGVPVRLRVVALKSGHRTNVKFLHVLKKYLKRKERSHFDIQEVLSIMPHRYPFLLVDRIVELQKDRVVGLKNVTIDEPFFQGHFPGNPIMPGVLVVEAMAQVGGFLLLHSVDERDNKLVYFLGMDEVKFRKPVRPGDQLRIEAKMLKLKGMICKIEGRAYVGENLVCEARLLSKIVER
jgi:UDP-3-O-[3-hydroxymyristoyl] N-acetylglucosamine deacetylase/3-hydroxyacyl-[acyl-carrier-protein] dehydratase